MQECAPLQAVAATMHGFGRPWWFAGGWAIDLFAGTQTRPHDDIEIGVWRDDQARLAEHLAAWSLSKVVDEAWVAWPKDERVELPDFQLRAVDPADPSREFQIFLNDTAAGAWQSRRHMAITRALDALTGTSAGGLPFLAPEVQLSFKAKYHRPQDEHDFALALPLMSAEQRGWLRRAIELIHPGDPWLESIRE